MALLNIETPQDLFTIAGISALIGLAYLIGTNRGKRQHFEFNFLGSFGNLDTTTGNYHWDLSGVIRNRSTADNTIVSIHKIVWKNKKKNSYLTDSTAIRVKDLSNSKELSLPIFFKGREAKKIEIYSDFIFEGSAEQKILQELYELIPGSKVYLHKYQFEALFEDIDGNYFDHQGRLINKEEADLWWTLPNTFEALKSWNLIPFVIHSASILYSRIKFSFRSALWNIGL